MKSIGWTQELLWKFWLVYFQHRTGICGSARDWYQLYSILRSGSAYPSNRWFEQKVVIPPHAHIFYIFLPKSVINGGSIRNRKCSTSEDSVHLCVNETAKTESAGKWIDTSVYVLHHMHICYNKGDKANVNNHKMFTERCFPRTAQCKGGNFWQVVTPHSDPQETS